MDSTTAIPETAPGAPAAEPKPGAVAGAAQGFAGLLVPLFLLRPARRWIVSPNRGTSTAVLLAVSVLWLFVLLSTAATFAVKGFPPFDDPPTLSPLTPRIIGMALLRAMIGVVQTQLFGVLILDWLFIRAFRTLPDGLGAFDRGLKMRMAFERGVVSIIGTLFVIGFSLLPLAALLVALPAVSPNEAVLSDTVRPTKSRWR